MENIIQHFRMHKTHVPEAKSVLWSRVPIAMGKVRYQSGDHTQHAKVLLQSPFWALVRGPKVNCEYISGRIAFSRFIFAIKQSYPLEKLMLMFQSLATDYQSNI